MKYYLCIFLLISLFIPLTSQAWVEIINPLKAESFTELLEGIVNFLMYLAIAIAPIMIVIAGFYFITAMGEPEKINTAKKIFIWTLIGLLIILSAWGIIGVIREIFETG